jgi:hypothetical protein
MEAMKDRTTAQTMAIGITNAPDSIHRPRQVLVPSEYLVRTENTVVMSSW